MILVSTGGFRERSAADAARELASEDITGIELSGGNYSDTLLEDLRALSPAIRFQVHNYFPPPAEPFVLNLASLDPEIGRRSSAHVEKALKWCAALGSDRYSFHAGFLLDPKVDELGGRIACQHLFDRHACIEVFVDRVSRAAEQAKKVGVTLMVENNVISSANALEFDENPLLMCDPKECQGIMDRMPEGVRLLIDVAHLKVSARSLGFDPAVLLSACHEWIAGYHLSDNNGLEDSNESFSADAWFWPHLKPDVGYYTIEVYGASPSQLRQQIDLVRSELFNR